MAFFFCSVAVLAWRSQEAPCQQKNRDWFFARFFWLRNGKAGPEEARDCSVHCKSHIGKELGPRLFRMLLSDNSVSHYAFMPDWLLPSLPLKGLCRITLFSTEFLLEDLNVLYGLFPFWLWTFAPRASLLGQMYRLFRVRTGA